MPSAHLPTSDQVLSRYHGQVALSDEFVSELKQALIEPKSTQLQEIIIQSVTLGTHERGKIPTFRSLRKEALKTTPHLFYSEAIERSAVASSLCGRLQKQQRPEHEFFLIWQICSHCMHSYADFTPDFSDEDMDRLLRTRALAAEDIGAANTFSPVRKYLKSAVRIADDVSDDSARQALYRQLVERLERAEAGMWQGGLSRFFFLEEDYGVLEELRRAIGATGSSSASRHKTDRDTDVAARRSVLLNRISPVWHNLFEWLLDLPWTSEELDKTLMADPKILALTEFDETDSGRVLADLARLRMDYPDWQGSLPVPPVERLGGLVRRMDWQSNNDAGFSVWNKLAVPASLLVQRPFRLDDADMARLIAVAQDWRPLCDFGLLNAAAATLQTGRAPQTLAALRALATRPSHCIVPGHAGPEYDGDVWWNGAPPRIHTLIEQHGGTQEAEYFGLVRFARMLFHRQ